MKDIYIIEIRCRFLKNSVLVLLRVSKSLCSEVTCDSLFQETIWISQSLSVVSQSRLYQNLINFTKVTNKMSKLIHP